MLQSIYRVVTSYAPIAQSTLIEQGMAISLDSNGKAIPCPAASRCIGLAADQNRNTMAGVWVDRVSDYGNETMASGEIAFYEHGEFNVDLNDGTILYPNGTAIPGVVANLIYAPMDTLVVSSTAGMLTKTGTAGAGSQIVATVLSVAAPLDSGIPGEYEPDSVQYVNDSIPRNWIRIKLEL